MFTWIGWVLFLAVSSCIDAKKAELKTPREAFSRIVNGHNAAKNQFPHHVEIKTIRGQRCWINGGTIISNYHVLTSAHTFVGEGIPMDSNTIVIIFVGSLKLSEGKKFLINLSNITPHEDFQKKPLKNDIAVIRTSSEIIFSGKVNEFVIVNFIIARFFF